MYKTYTIKEFRNNTRVILNEALKSPIKITRYDDEFILSTASNMPNQITDKHYVANTTQNIISPLSKCPNGHAIPEGRDRCLGKGCKHS